MPSALFTKAEALGEALLVDELLIFVEVVLALVDVTLLEDVSAFDEDEDSLVEVVEGFVDVETLDEVDAGLVDVEDLSELEDPLDEHVPELGLQPVPQYSAVLPQYPYWLQQFPNTEPRHVMVVPHDPSVLTA